MTDQQKPTTARPNALGRRPQGTRPTNGPAASKRPKTPAGPSATARPPSAAGAAARPGAPGQPPSNGRQRPRRAPTATNASNLAKQHARSGNSGGAVPRPRAVENNNAPQNMPNADIPADNFGMPPNATQEEFREFLTRICEKSGLEGGDIAHILERQQLLFNETNVALQLQETGGLVKIYVDVGMVPEGDMDPLFRRILQQQLYLDVPFQFIPAVHPTSHRAILFSFIILPRTPEEDEIFIKFVEECARRAHAMGEAIGIGA